MHATAHQCTAKYVDPPDINIIENLWDHLERRIRARNLLPRSEEDLWIALQEEWYKIDISIIEKLYASLPQRVQAVYSAKGGNTRYWLLDCITSNISLVVELLLEFFFCIHPFLEHVMVILVFQRVFIRCSPNFLCAVYGCIPCSMQGILLRSFAVLEIYARLQKIYHVTIFLGS